ncbi:MAG: SIS domain-containing protein [Mangrovibacterium sp.]
MIYIPKIAAYFDLLKKTIDNINKEDLNAIMNVLVEAKDNGKQIFIMGNGGSAATASHFVCDFNKGISFGKEKKFKFLCLNDNIPSLMAYGNDLSYDDIFLYPLMTYFHPGDVVIGISGSGNSKNVVKALEYANKNNGITIGLTGYDGGKVKMLCQYNVHIPVNDMQITEDLHMVLDHCMMKILYKNR